MLHKARHHLHPALRLCLIAVAARLDCCNSVTEAAMKSEELLYIGNKYVQAVLRGEQPIVAYDPGIHSRADVPAACCRSIHIIQPQSQFHPQLSDVTHVRIPMLHDPRCVLQSIERLHRCRREPWR